jgi:two-component system, OmpR family, response regulator
LSRQGYAVDHEDNGVDAEFMGETEPYDLIILDLGLPQRPGLEVLKNWRDKDNDVPVIILTARDAWHEKVDGFKAGADDYLAKPFHTEELLARIQAILNRKLGKQANALSHNGLRLDEDRQVVTLEDGVEKALTGIEFRLLRYFMLHAGQILSKSRLTEHVYEYDEDKDSNVIEVYVNHLRGKIGKPLIQTRRGQGYIFGNPP